MGNKKRTYKPRRIIICEKCGQLKPIHAHNMCQLCYDIIRNNRKRELELEGYKKYFTPYEKGWIECFLETDGYIGLSIPKTLLTKRGWSLSLDVAFCNTSKKLLDFIDNILGNIGHFSGSMGTKHYKHTLKIPQKHLRWILPQLTLIQKEKRRKMAIEYIENMIKFGRGRIKHLKDEYETWMSDFSKKIIILREIESYGWLK